MVADPGHDLRKPCLTWEFTVTGVTFHRRGLAGVRALMSGWRRPGAARSGPCAKYVPKS